MKAFFDAVDFAYSRWWLAFICTLISIYRLWVVMDDSDASGSLFGWRLFILTINLIWLWDVTYGPTSEKCRG